MDNRTDAFSPAEIFRRVEDASTKKSGQTVYQTFALAFLGGAFIAIGALLYLQIISGAAGSDSIVRLVGGVGFSLGLVMIVVGGAELFTGNMLLVMALVDRLISLADILRNWTLVLAGNALGGVALVMLAAGGGLLDAGAPLAEALQRVVAAKSELGFFEAFCRGVLCNVLVCMAVWLVMSCLTTISRIVSVVFPIAAFVTLGLEHSIANLAFFPAHMLATGSGDLSWVASNLIPVTLGNMVGGGVLVALVYRSVYRTTA